METKGTFKIAQFQTLKIQTIEILEEPNLVRFHIEAIDREKQSYFLSFTTLLPASKMLEFKLGEHIDLTHDLEKGETILGDKGSYALGVKVTLDLLQYLPNRFCLSISFEEKDDLVGSIELEFAFQNRVEDSK